MTECNGCGVCCDPVISVVPPHMLKDGRADEIIGFEEAEWMRQHLTPILPRREGMAMVKVWSTGTSESVVLGEFVQMLSWFYSCEFYDRENKACTAYDRRPDMCSGFPWFDTAPDPQKNLPPTCSYREDIGQEVALEMPTRKVRTEVGFRDGNGRRVW